MSCFKDPSGSLEMLTLPIPCPAPWVRGELVSQTLGLSSVQQVEYLIKKKHIYLPKNSRINFTCINAHNIDYITQSINEAVLSTKGLD